MINTAVDMDGISLPNAIGRLKDHISESGWWDISAGRLARESEAARGNNRHWHHKFQQEDDSYRGKLGEYLLNICHRIFFHRYWHMIREIVVIIITDILLTYSYYRLSSVYCEGVIFKWAY